MKKILFSDMDGTIIEKDEIIDIRDGKMLEELRLQGHLVAFNTGRNEEEAHFCLDKHLFPYDYLVLNNGAHIVDKDGHEVFKKVIPAHVGRKMIEYCLNYKDLFIHFYNGGRTLGYCNGKTYVHSDEGNKEIHDVQFLEEYLKADSFDIIAVYQVNEDIDKALIIQKYIQENFGEYAEGCLNTHYLDITASGCTKGSGMTTLKNILGDVETYCIGDSYNDISMFKVADHAYTFHRVDKEISQYASSQVDFVYEVVEDMLK